MHASLLKNTLISPFTIEKILSLPKDEGTYATTAQLINNFQEMKGFASEIHTETHLIKPILKNLGYAYESKPKFFEDHVKGPDVALFSQDQERVDTSDLWGTREYYTHTLCILLLKRYGSNLQEGISGFYLEFENRIPLYQMMYLLKKSKTPWGILTNGKNWILLKRPLHFEKKLVEMDIEASLTDIDSLHLFHHIFSCHGLASLMPELLEEERTELIDVLRTKKISYQKSLRETKKRSDMYAMVVTRSKELFPDNSFSLTESYLKERQVTLLQSQGTPPSLITEYNTSDIASYLFSKRDYPLALSMEDILIGEKTKFTKEDLLTQKILDMTPGFGTVTTQLIESIAYLSFTLPYKTKNTFVAEWEDEVTLKKYIIDNLLYGIERSPVALDILHSTMKHRFSLTARNYKLGNPLIGMSIKDIYSFCDTKNQLSLFDRNPQDIIREFETTYKHYFSLSDKIKEDVVLKKDLEITLKQYSDRLQDILDMITTTYLYRIVDSKKIQDIVTSLGSDEITWNNMRKKEWFITTKDVAKKNGFFHMEIEFPFLLLNKFDFIFVRPDLNYIWEEEIPLIEATKSYVKRGMPYLKDHGTMVLILEKPLEALVAELQKSKRYEMTFAEGSIILRKRM